MSLEVAAALAAFQLYSANRNARMLMDQNELTSRVNELNAEELEIDAFEAEKMGHTRASRYQSVIDATIGQQKVINAAQGVDTTSGTAADLVEENRLVGQLNLMDIIKQAELDARGIKNQAFNLRLNIGAANAQTAVTASNTRTAGVFNAGSTLLSGYGRE